MQGVAAYVPAPPRLPGDCSMLHRIIDLLRSYVSQMALAEGIRRNQPRRV